MMDVSVPLSVSFDMINADCRTLVSGESMRRRLEHNSAAGSREDRLQVSYLVLELATKPSRYQNSLLTPVT